MKRPLGKIAAAFFVLVLAAGAATHAQAQTLTVLHSFTSSGGDGEGPRARLVMDAAGNLYGTTEFGGASGAGIAFKLDPSGNETVLHSFTSTPDGAVPEAGLIMDAAGNLYGTTEGGGTGGVASGAAGGGTVFKLDPSGNETVLYSFVPNTVTDGFEPFAGLVMDAAGNLYGTTAGGGPSDLGIVFKVAPSGNETVLHGFTGSPDGASPTAGLIRDVAGNLYGTTEDGGAVLPLNEQDGSVFKLDPGGNETVLHTFMRGPDGFHLIAGLVMDAAGNLYGTTPAGGSLGLGTVFKLDASGNLTVLHSFAGAPDDGEIPYADLIMDAAGNLYGTTFGGGSGTCHDFTPLPLAAGAPFPGCGTVFKLDPSGNLTVLHSFAGSSSDGAHPLAGLVMDAAGNLYGTTENGGGSSNCPITTPAPVPGCGTVFKLTIQAPPTITTISPTSTIAGGPGFTLTVNGTNFVSGSTVNFNGSALVTTFVSAMQLTAVVPASDTATAGSFNVTVTDPGDGTSNAIRFTVVTPQQATQTIINSVNALFLQAVINGGQDNSLVGQLQHAINLMNAGKNAGAIGNLDSFITQVNDLLSSGVLSPSQAASLVSAAQSVIAAIP